MEYLSVFSPNARKYGPGKLRTETFYTHWPWFLWTLWWIFERSRRNETIYSTNFQCTVDQKLILTICFFRNNLNFVIQRTMKKCFLIFYKCHSYCWKIKNCLPSCNIIKVLWNFEFVICEGINNICAWVKGCR